MDDGERDPVSQTQTAILTIPGQYNTGSLTLTCIITPDPCEIGYTQHQRYNDKSTSTDGSTSGGETSGGETSGGETSGGGTSGGETSGGETSGGETSGGETSGGETSGGETSGDETSGGETSGGETSGGKTSGGSTSGGETSGGETSNGGTTDDSTTRTESTDTGNGESNKTSEGDGANQNEPADPSKSTCNETLVDGVQRDIIPGIVDVVLNELANSGTQCSVDTIRSLMKESFSGSSPGNLAKPCFSIMEKGSGSKYVVDSTQKYVSPGNNLEIKPLSIYSSAFGESTVYR